MAKKFTFITQYSRTPEQVRNFSVVEFKEPSKVKESLSYAVNINTIYENYCKTGKLPLNGQRPIYNEDFVKLDNLIEAQQTVKEACRYFQSLPSDIRNHYGNSLEKFVSSVHSNDQFLFDKGVLLKKDKLIAPSEPSIESSNPVDNPIVSPSLKDSSNDSSTTV